jgi:hypothetical protein
MFSLFVEDLELYLQDNLNSGLLIDDIVLILLLFADDMAIVGKTPEDLQNSLDLLYSYCFKWGLEVNTMKTKIVVFRKRGRIFINEKWTYNGQPIEVVDHFNYLGTVFSYTGNFSLNNEHLTGKALKAMNTLLINCKDMDLKPKLLCQLFDSFVGSIISYASEVWGYSKSKDIERIHLKFCKRILNVRANTSNVSIYGELGRYPLYINRYVRIIKFWCKLINTDNIILRKIYELSLSDCYKGKKNWVSNVKEMLNMYGLSEYFFENNIVDSKSFPKLFKQRIIDNYIQTWHSSLENNSVLELYKNCKELFSYENYLNILPKNLRFYITRIRMSAHTLRVQTGRYGQNRIPRSERYCLFCNTMDLEDEYHFVLICPCYVDIRKKYVKQYYYKRPSMCKFIELISSNNKIILMNLAKYLRESIKIRNTFVSTNT